MKKRIFKSNYFIDVAGEVNMIIKNNLLLKPVKTLRDLNVLDKLSVLEKNWDLKTSKITNHYYIKQRKERLNIPHSFKIKKFSVGDIFQFVYSLKSIALTFNGICLSLKKKGFFLPDVSIITRNVLLQTHIEITASYFYNRLYNLQFLDYKRKFYNYNKNKLYFIRNKINQYSRV